MGLAQRVKSLWSKKQDSGAVKLPENRGNMGEYTVKADLRALDAGQPEGLWEGLNLYEEILPDQLAFEDELERQALRYPQEMEELW